MSLRNGIILEEKKLVFWYVPKNACTSIKKVLPELLFRFGIGDKLPILNKSDRVGGYREQFNDRLRDMAIDYYQNDLTTYNYEY